MRIALFYIASITLGAMLFFMNHAVPLVNIRSVNPHIRLDIRYATPHNFTGKVIYSKAVCYVHKDIASRLDKLQKELEQQGLGLLIFDGYRPPAAVELFWEIVQDERYVAHPAKGSRHSRGCTIDCTLVDAQGTPLAMGTDFDDFSPKSHKNCTNLSAKERKNRALLDSFMKKYGFVGVKTEWWHYDDKNWQQYPPIDADLEKVDAP